MAASSLLLRLAVLIACLGWVVAPISYTLWTSSQCSVAPAATSTTGLFQEGCLVWNPQSGCTIYGLFTCSGSTPTLKNCSDATCSSCEENVVQTTGTCSSICSGGLSGYGVIVNGCVTASPSPSPSVKSAAVGLSHTPWVTLAAIVVGAVASQRLI